MTVGAFTTGIRQGDLRAPGALERFLKSKRLPSAAATAEQVHDSQVRFIPKLRRSKKIPLADGLLTDVPEQPLAIFTADCVPLFLRADQDRVVGVLHAGWRGVQKGILAKAVALVRKKWTIKPSRIEVWPGPYIGSCCFEVQWDVARHFPLSRRRRKNRWVLDLGRELQAQARRLGVRWTRKTPSEGCTMHGSRYFSYRRDKTNKRQVSVMIKR